MNKFEPSKFSVLYKLGKILLAIFYYANIIILAILFIFGIYSIVNPNYVLMLSDISMDGSFILNTVGLKINIATTYIPDEISLRKFYFAISFISILQISTLIYILFQLRGIVSKVDKKEPFHIENGHRLRNIALTVLGASFIFPAFDALLQYLEINTFRLTNVTVTYSENDFLLLAGFLLLMLSTIFNYGCYLQTEYDETI